MDVSYYLSELLGQLGEVNVPGLGVFVLSRRDGYYNDAEGVFYPRGSSVQFDPQFVDDDSSTLEQYIAGKKNISLASSKYFTKKYIDNLKEEVMLSDVALADMGWLYFEDSKLNFKPAAAQHNNPAFFGYPPVKLSKLGGTSFLEQLETMNRETPPPVTADPEPAPSSIAGETPEETGEPVINQWAEPGIMPADYGEPEIFAPEIQEEEQDYLADIISDEEESSRMHTWIIVSMTILAAALAIYGLYEYNPAVFDRFRNEKPAPAVVKKTDTVKKETPAAANDSAAHAKDTTASLNNQPAAIDTFSRIHYEISGGAYKTLKRANKEVANYEKLGFNARILQHATGKLIKLTLGTYFTEKEAIDAENDMLKTGKISKGRIGIQPYYPKTNPKP